MPDILGTLKIPRLAAAPSTPVVGQMYYDTVANEVRWWNGTIWVPAKDIPTAGGADLSFDGDWVAGTYQDGDTVVKDGVVFMCVGGPTTTAPDPTLWGSLAAPAPLSIPDRLAANVKVITDWNLAIENGFYGGNNAANSPVELARASTWATGEVIALNPVYVVQRIWDALGPVGTMIYERKMWNGAWTSWVGIGSNNYGTSLPASPVDGQEYILVDSVSNPSYQWRFRYNVLSSSAYKWEFMGGPPAFTYANVVSIAGSPVTAVPFTLPRGGDFIQTVCGHCVVAAGVTAVIQVYDGTTANSVFAWDVGMDSHNGGMGSYKWTGKAAATVLSARFSKPSADTQGFNHVSSTITPVRVS